VAELFVPGSAAVEAFDTRGTLFPSFSLSHEESSGAAFTCFTPLGVFFAVVRSPEAERFRALLTNFWHPKSTQSVTQNNNKKKRKRGKSVSSAFSSSASSELRIRSCVFCSHASTQPLSIFCVRVASSKSPSHQRLLVQPIKLY
jgi:hypothetical protein